MPRFFRLSADNARHFRVLTKAVSNPYSATAWHIVRPYLHPHGWCTDLINFCAQGRFQLPIVDKCPKISATGISFGGMSSTRFPCDSASNNNRRKITWRCRVFSLAATPSPKRSNQFEYVTIVHICAGQLRRPFRYHTYPPGSVRAGNSIIKRFVLIDPEKLIDSILSVYNAKEAAFIRSLYAMNAIIQLLRWPSVWRVTQPLFFAASSTGLSNACRLAPSQS